MHATVVAPPDRHGGQTWGERRARVGAKPHQRWGGWNQSRQDRDDNNGRSSGKASAPAEPSELKADSSQTKTWDFAEYDEFAMRRNDEELRYLFKMLGQNMQQLTVILLNRFGQFDDGPNLEQPLKGDIARLEELDLQLGRRAEAHFTDADGRKRKEFIIDPLDESLPATSRDHRVNADDIALFQGLTSNDQFKPGWWTRNGGRTGIPQTLHRVSGIGGRDANLIGVVVRVGRSVVGTLERMLPEDIRSTMESVLLIGPPNCGKTTILREFARMISERDDRVAVVVDKTSEIAGASNEPHPAIGVSCRWMPLDDPRNQHEGMRCAVENFAPNTVLVDEISTELECKAAKTISQRGVQLIATCHGKSMAEVIHDHDRSGLLGSLSSVKLSNKEIDQRIAAGGSAEKHVFMRRFPPLFGMVIELHSRDVWYVHTRPSESIDAYLRQDRALCYRATPGKLEQVVAIPEEEGFRYEPAYEGRFSEENSAASQRSVKTMTMKGAEGLARARDAQAKAVAKPQAKAAPKHQ